MNLIILSLVNVDTVDADGDAFVVTAKVQRHGSIRCERLLQEDRGQLEGRGGQVKEVVAQQVVSRTGLEDLQSFEERAQRFRKVVYEVCLVCTFH